MDSLETLKYYLSFVNNHIKSNPTLPYKERLNMINESIHKAQSELGYSNKQIKSLVHSAGVSLVTGKVLGTKKLRYQLRKPSQRVPLKLAKKHCNLALIEAY